MSGTITISFELGMLIPTLEVYKDYFDNKYPCTDETNDGSGMPIEDRIKEQVYQWLLAAYTKHNETSKDAYNLIMEKAKSQLTQ